MSCCLPCIELRSVADRNNKVTLPTNKKTMSSQLGGGRENLSALVCDHSFGLGGSVTVSNPKLVSLHQRFPSVHPVLRFDSVAGSKDVPLLWTPKKVHEPESPQKRRSTKAQRNRGGSRQFDFLVPRFLSFYCLLSFLQHTSLLISQTFHLQGLSATSRFSVEPTAKLYFCLPPIHPPGLSVDIGLRIASKHSFEYVGYLTLNARLPSLESRRVDITRPELVNQRPSLIIVPPGRDS